MMDDELNQRLKKLVSEIQTEKNNQVRGRLFKQLIDTIQGSNKLNYYYHLIPDYLKGCHSEIYAEAVQRLFIWLNKNVHKYDPNKAEVMTWINNKLSYLMRDVRDEFKNNSLDEVPIFSLNDLDRLEETGSKNKDNDQEIFLSEKVIKVIEDDPDNIFKKTHMRNNPQANFQRICLDYYQGYSWTELSKILNSSISGLSRFYHNNLEHFSPLIRGYLQE